MDLIDYRDARPIYEQIAERYKTLILRGVLQPDEQLPSVRSLAMDLSTNPNTVQKAYTALEHEGYIYTVKGKGNYVCDATRLLEEKKQDIAARIAELLTEAVELGFTVEEVLQLAKGSGRESAAHAQDPAVEGAHAKPSDGGGHENIGKETRS